MLECLKNCVDFNLSKKTLIDLNLIVKVYQDIGLYLVKYDKNNDNVIFNEDTMKCKGLILDMNNNIVCAPPFKSVDISCINSLGSEEQKKVVYEEFIDGTMINIFYYNGWHISTRSCIGANCRWYSNKNFCELFDECKNFNVEDLNRDYCYNFVLKHSENRIVTKYDVSSLVLVGAYCIKDNIINFLDIEEVKNELSSIDLEIPKKFVFENVASAYEYCNNLPYDNQGLVLKYNNFRSKITNQHYNYVKSLRGNTRNIKYMYFELRKNGYDMEFLNYYPEYKEQFNAFQTELFDITKKLFNYYQDFRVKKTIEYKDIEYQYRPHIYELHGNYLTTKRIVTFTRVKYYVNNIMASAQILFVLNYKKKNNSNEASEDDNISNDNSEL